MVKPITEVEGSTPSDDSTGQTSDQPAEGAAETTITEPEAEALEEVQAPAPVVTDPSVLAAFEAKVADSISFLEAVGFQVTHRSVARASSASSGSGRDTDIKAEPAMVEAYFDGTGLTRRQIADAVGVGMSVISTVTKEAGDRWSLVRFERAKVLIEAERARIAALLLAPVAAPAEETESVEETVAA